MNPEPPGAPSTAQMAAFFQKCRTGLVTLVFTDLVDSTALLHQLGDQAGTTFLRQRRQILREVLHTLPEAEEIETAGDSFLLVFAKPSDAVRFALLSQARLRAFSAQSRLPVQERMGIHLGEVVISEHETEVKAKDLYGIQSAACARVMSLAQGGQVLLTRGVFDSARQVLKGEDLTGVGPLSWVSHGPYVLKGIEEAVEVCEVGEAGPSPLAAPKTSEKAQRVVRADEEPVLGWRPAVGQEVPNAKWVLEQKLGEGGFGEVCVGRHEQALARIPIARTRDPLNPALKAYEGNCLLYARRLPDARLKLEEVLDTVRLPATRFLWQLHWMEGRETEALEMCRTYFSMLPNSKPVVGALNQPRIGGGYAEAMRRAAGTLAAQGNVSYVQPTLVAQLYVHAGEKDLALQWLRRALGIGDPLLIFLNVDPAWDVLRSDPRFPGLRKDVGLPTPEGDSGKAP